MTNRTAFFATFMNQDQTYGHKGQGPGKSFLVLMRFLSYQLVHLLVHTNNGKVMFYHTSAVERGVMGDGQNVLAPRLARERAWGTIERMMNFDAPSDLTRFLQIDQVKMEGPTLKYAEVVLKDKEEAREALRLG